MEFGELGEETGKTPVPAETAACVAALTCATTPHQAAHRIGWATAAATD